MSKATTIEIINLELKEVKNSFQKYVDSSHLDMMASIYKAACFAKINSEPNQDFYSHEQIFELILEYISNNDYPCVNDLIETIEETKEELLPKKLSLIISKDIATFSLDDIDYIKKYLERIFAMSVSLLPPSFFEKHSITDIIPVVLVNKIINKLFDVLCERPNQFKTFIWLIDKLRGYLYENLLERSASTITNMYTQKEFFFSLYGISERNFASNFKEGLCFEHESMENVNKHRKKIGPNNKTQYYFYSMDDVRFLPPEKGEEQKERTVSSKTEELEEITNIERFFSKRSESVHLNFLGDDSRISTCFQNDSFGLISLFFEYFLKKYSKTISKIDEQLFSACDRFYDFDSNPQFKQWISATIFDNINKSSMDALLSTSFSLDSYTIPYTILTTCKPLRARVINNFSKFVSQYKTILFPSLPEKRYMYFNVNIGPTGPMVIRKMPCQTITALEEFIVSYNKLVLNNESYFDHESVFDKMTIGHLEEIGHILQLNIPPHEVPLRLKEIQNKTQEKEFALVSLNDKHFFSMIGEAELYPMCNQLTIKNKHDTLKLREYILRDLVNIKKSLKFEKEKYTNLIENDPLFYNNPLYTIKPNCLRELVVNIDTDVIFYHLLNFRLSHMEEDKFTGNVYIKMGEYPCNNVTKFHSKNVRDSLMKDKNKIRGVFNFKKLFQGIGRILMKDDCNPFVSHDFAQETFSIIMMMGGTDYIKYRIKGVGHKTLYDTLVEYYHLIGDIGEIKLTTSKFGDEIKFIVYNKIHAIYSMIFYCKKTKKATNLKATILNIVSSMKNSQSSIIKEIIEKERKLLREIDDSELPESEKLDQSEDVKNRMTLLKFDTLRDYYIKKIEEHLTTILKNDKDLQEILDITLNQGKVLQWVVDYFSNAIIGNPHPVMKDGSSQSLYGFKMINPELGWVHGNVVNSLSQKGLPEDPKKKPREKLISLKSSSTKPSTKTAKQKKNSLPINSIIDCFEEENKKEATTSKKKRSPTEDDTSTKKPLSLPKKSKGNIDSKDDDIEDYIMDLKKSKKNNKK